MAATTTLEQRSDKMRLPKGSSQQANEDFLFLKPATKPGQAQIDSGVSVSKHDVTSENVTNLGAEEDENESGFYDVPWDQANPGDPCFATATNLVARMIRAESADRAVSSVRPRPDGPTRNGPHRSSQAVTGVSSAAAGPLRSRKKKIPPPVAAKSKNGTLHLSMANGHQYSVKHQPGSAPLGKYRPDSLLPQCLKPTTDTFERCPSKLAKQPCSPTALIQQYLSKGISKTEQGLHKQRSQQHNQQHSTKQNNHRNDMPSRQSSLSHTPFSACFGANNPNGTLQSDFRPTAPPSQGSVPSKALLPPPVKATTPSVGMVQSMHQDESAPMFEPTCSSAQNDSSRNEHIKNNPRSRSDGRTRQGSVTFGTISKASRGAGRPACGIQARNLKRNAAVAAAASIYPVEPLDRACTIQSNYDNVAPFRSPTNFEATRGVSFDDNVKIASDVSSRKFCDDNFDNNANNVNNEYDAPWDLSADCRELFQPNPDQRRMSYSPPSGIEPASTQYPATREHRAHSTTPCLACANGSSSSTQDQPIGLASTSCGSNRSFASQDGSCRCNPCQRPTDRHFHRRRQCDSIPGLSYNPDLHPASPPPDRPKTACSIPVAFPRTSMRSSYSRETVGVNPVENIPGISHASYAGQCSGCCCSTSTNQSQRGARASQSPQNRQISHRAPVYVGGGVVGNQIGSMAFPRSRSSSNIKAPKGSKSANGPPCCAPSCQCHSAIRNHQSSQQHRTDDNIAPQHAFFSNPTTHSNSVSTDMLFFGQRSLTPNETGSCCQSQSDGRPAQNQAPPPVAEKPKWTVTSGKGTTSQSTVDENFNNAPTLPVDLLDTNCRCGEMNDTGNTSPSLAVELNVDCGSVIVPDSPSSVARMKLASGSTDSGACGCSSGPTLSPPQSWTSTSLSAASSSSTTSSHHSPIPSLRVANRVQQGSVSPRPIPRSPLTNVDQSAKHGLPEVALASQHQPKSPVPVPRKSLTRPLEELTNRDSQDCCSNPIEPGRETISHASENAPMTSSTTTIKSSGSSSSHGRAGSRVLTPADFGLGDDAILGETKHGNNRRASHLAACASDSTGSDTDPCCPGTRSSLQSAPTAFDNAASQAVYDLPPSFDKSRQSNPSAVVATGSDIGTTSQDTIGDAGNEESYDVPWEFTTPQLPGNQQQNSAIQNAADPTEVTNRRRSKQRSGSADQTSHTAQNRLKQSAVQHPQNYHHHQNKYPISQPQQLQQQQQQQQQQLCCAGRQCSKNRVSASTVVNNHLCRAQQTTSCNKNNSGVACATSSNTTSNMCRQTGGRKLSELANLSNCDLERHRWYHGSISRAEAEERLRNANEGGYLVRVCESNDQEYALSVKSSKTCLHMKIQRNPDGKWVLGFFSQPFATIGTMVAYYSVHKLPIKGAEHMCLLLPVPNR